MNEIIIVDIECNPVTRNLIFNGVEDARYNFPVWSWMSSRGCRVFFKDGDRQETIGGKFDGVLEVYAKVAKHRL